METTIPTQTGLSISDIGPIDEFNLDMDRPGLWVLRGRHGAGKTTILRTVQLATSGKTDVKPTKRDGRKRGSATVAGKTLTITKRIREEGDLSVEGLGELDIATLHAPKYVDAKTRDKHRINTLIRLAGVKADASMFHELIGGKNTFEKVVDPDAVSTDDLLDMAGRVKRSFEKAAQERERNAATAEATMRAQDAIAEGIDMSRPSDDAELRQAVNAAIKKAAALAQQRKTALDIIAKAKESQQDLDQHKEQAETLNEFERQAERATDALDKARDEVANLEKKLAAARSKLDAAESDYSRAMDHVKAAQAAKDLIARWQQDIDAAGKVELPTKQDIEAAQAAVDAANAAMEYGLRVRQAIKANEHSAIAAAELKMYQKNAGRLRDAAAGVQDVLSDAIANIADCPLRVVEDSDGNARLVIKTDRSDAEPFDELSDGERWPVIIRIAAQANRLIVLPQAAFGELSASSRQQLHDLATDHGCYILTAQVDDEELRGEIWTGVK